MAIKHSKSGKKTISAKANVKTKTCYCNSNRSIDPISLGSQISGFGLKMKKVIYLYIERFIGIAYVGRTIQRPEVRCRQHFNEGTGIYKSASGFTDYFMADLTMETENVYKCLETVVLEFVNSIMSTTNSKGRTITDKSPGVCFDDMNRAKVVFEKIKQDINDFINSLKQ